MSLAFSVLRSRLSISSRTLQLLKTPRTSQQPQKTFLTSITTGGIKAFKPKRQIIWPAKALASITLISVTASCYSIQQSDLSTKCEEVLGVKWVLPATFICFVTYVPCVYLLVAATLPF